MTSNAVYTCLRSPPSAFHAGIDGRAYSSLLPVHQAYGGLPKCGPLAGATCSVHGHIISFHTLLLHPLQQHQWLRPKPRAAASSHSTSVADRITSNVQENAHCLLPCSYPTWRWSSQSYNHQHRSTTTTTKKKKKTLPSLFSQQAYYFVSSNNHSNSNSKATEHRQHSIARSSCACVIGCHQQLSCLAQCPALAEIHQHVTWGSQGAHVTWAWHTQPSQNKKSRNFKRKTMLIMLNMLNQLQLPHFESTPQKPPKPASEHITKHIWISRNMPAPRRHECILKFKSMTQTVPMKPMHSPNLVSLLLFALYML